MLAVIAESRPGELLSIEYTGMVMNGKEDTSSDIARKFIGAHETYRLSKADGKTRLDMEADMDEDMYEMMAESWKTACRKIVELAEN